MQETGGAWWIPYEYPFQPAIGVALCPAANSRCRQATDADLDADEGLRGIHNQLGGCFFPLPALG